MSLNELLFFSPIVTFYLPEDAIVDFILSSTTAVLMGELVSMNVFVLKHSKNLKVSIGSLLLGSTSALFQVHVPPVHQWAFFLFLHLEE